LKTRQENEVIVTKIRPQWYRSKVTIDKTTYVFFGYSKEEVYGRAMREIEKREVFKR